jgi:hypothetical protein
MTDIALVVKQSQLKTGPLTAADSTRSGDYQKARELYKSGEKIPWWNSEEAS